MASEKQSIYRFNYGAIDRRAMSHVDVKKLALAAQTQTNWMSRVIGHMSLRPGLGFVGEIAGNPGAPAPTTIYASGDTSIALGVTGAGDSSSKDGSQSISLGMTGAGASLAKADGSQSISLGMTGAT